MNFVQQFIQAFAPVGIHGADRFVQHDDLRVHRQQRGQGQTLPLPAGQFVQLIIFPPRQAYVFQRFAGAFFRFFRREPVVQQAERYFFPGGEGHQLAFIILQHQPYLHGQVGNFFAFRAFSQHFHVPGIIAAGIIGHDSRHGLAERGLPRAAGSDDDRKRSFFDFQVYVFQHKIRAEIFKIKVRNSNDGIHSSSPPPCA